MTTQNPAPGGIDTTRPDAEEDPDNVGSVTSVYRQASSQLHVRSLPDVLRFFEGFEPGLTWITQWRPEPGTEPIGRQHSMRGGVGRRP